MDNHAPYHAHIYYADEQRGAAVDLRESFQRLAAAGGAPRIDFVGSLRDRPIGPHPIAQFEIHFARDALAGVTFLIEASGLRALVHPLTDNDLADHTSLAQWIGERLDLDLSVLDPPGENQGVPRFGKTDF